MLIALLLVVQVGVLVRDSLALQLAAREAARELAVSADDARTREAMRRSAGPLDHERIELTIVPPPEERLRGRPAGVRLRYVARLRIPVIDRIVTTELPLTAQAVMRLERPGATPTPSPSPSPAPEPESEASAAGGA